MPLRQHVGHTSTPETENINVIGRFSMPLGEDWNLSLTGSWFDSKGEQNRRQFAVPAGSVVPQHRVRPGPAAVHS